MHSPLIKTLAALINNENIHLHPLNHVSIDSHSHKMKTKIIRILILNFTITQKAKKTQKAN